MPYTFLEDIAIADVAFRAWGRTMEEMFIAATQATMQVMVEDLNTIALKENRSVNLQNPSPDMLLFDLLQELIYLKDAEQLLVCITALKIHRQGKNYSLKAQLQGEKLNPRKHELVVDVKAVTLHRYEVKQIPGGWESHIILDI